VEDGCDDDGAGVRRRERRHGSPEVRLGAHVDVALLVQTPNELGEETERVDDEDATAAGVLAHGGSFADLDPVPHRGGRGEHPGKTPILELRGRSARDPRRGHCIAAGELMAYVERLPGALVVDRDGARTCTVTGLRIPERH
jgi:hypothetical protein